MALDIAFYKVSKEIAIRSGLISERYRTQDGYYILDNKDLSRVRFTTDEYINGLSGIERITENEAKELIALGGYKFGYDGLIETPSEEAVVAEEKAPADEQEEEPTEETTEETNEKKEEE